MQIPLNQFEQYIDETILKRGLSYFKNGQVNEPEEISAGTYEAIVEGSEDYTVSLHVENEVVTDYNCSCPYDLGPVCKHVVAVIFYMQQEVLELQDKNSETHRSKQKKKSKPAKAKSVADKINVVLDALSHEDLKQLIREKTQADRAFRNIFFSSFVHLTQEDSKDFYEKQVKAILRSAAGRDGFIDWSSGRRVGKEVYELLNVAQQHIKNKNFRSAIFICLAVMEQMTKALEYCDDSNGDIGGPIDFAYEMLFEITGELSEENHHMLFNYCVDAYQKRIYSGWDWHLGMLTMASELSKSDHETGIILRLLDEVNGSEFHIERAQSIKLEILKKTKGADEAQFFLEQNLANSSFRREAIANALNGKDYQKGIKLAKDGIDHDKKDKPGLAKEWYDWLLKIAQDQNDKEKIVEYARFLFIDNFRNEQDYYQLMKSNVPVDKWNEFVAGIIQDISSASRWHNVDQLAGIYIREEWWDKLIKLVSQNSSLSMIENYERYLAKDYASELASLYENALTEYMKNNMGRGSYQNACKYLRRMIKLGAKEKVYTITSELRRQYPQRKALMEELDKI